MSMWTHITACLSVDTCIEKEASELKQTIVRQLEKAPKITGSEGPADIFVNIQSGYNVSAWTFDCSHCEYKDSLHEVVEDGKTYQECNGPNDHDCFVRYQTCIVISIQGDLRDRTRDQTKKEFNKFIEYITKKCKWLIRDYNVNIEGI